MFCFSLILLCLAACVDVLQGHLLRLDQPQVEEHVQLGHCLGEPAALVQPNKFDGIAALMAAVTVPAGLVHLEGCRLLPVEGAADVSASVRLVAVVLNDLPGGDALLNDRSSFHDGHGQFTTLMTLLSSSTRSRRLVFFAQKNSNAEWNGAPFLLPPNFNFPLIKT